MSFADGLHAGGEHTRAKPPTPFSLRLSEAERARLKAEAGNQPLNTFSLETELVAAGNAASMKKNLSEVASQVRGAME